MFGTNTIKSGLTFGKVLSGISKTLSIANQVIPLYQQAMPMINNAKTIFNTLKSIKSDTKTSDSKKFIINDNNKTENLQNIKITTKNSNNPIFFQ